MQIYNLLHLLYIYYLKSQQKMYNYTSYNCVANTMTYTPTDLYICMYMNIIHIYVYDLKSQHKNIYLYNLNHVIFLIM